MLKSIIGDCETPVVAGSRWAALVRALPVLTLVIQNQEFAENVCRALIMIYVRSSLDSGVSCVRLTQTVSDGFRVCLTRGIFVKKCPRVVFATT